MNDFSPSPEFEKKVKAATSTPPADPDFVNRLRIQLTDAAVQPTNLFARLTHLLHPLNPSITNQNIPQGEQSMLTRLKHPAVAVAILAVIAAFFVFNPATPVSAQQILDRASAAQSSAIPAQGIWHTRIEIHKNPQMLDGDQAGTTTVDDTYESMGSSSPSGASASAVQTMLYRSVTTDAAGKILEIAANDGSFDYFMMSDTIGGSDSQLTIHRTPISQKETTKNQKRAPIDPAAIKKSLFDQFNNNPRVKAEKVTQTDGRQVYVLVDDNYQTQKPENGQDVKVLTGSMSMTFDAQTYQLLESKTGLQKDGKEIVIEYVHYLVDEILPAGSQVAWNLSDIKTATVVDEPKAVQESSSPTFKVITVQELASHTQAWVLKTIPAGFTQEIIESPDQVQGEPYKYEVNYHGQDKASFDMMGIGVEDAAFIQTNFYDGSYKTASGIVIHYSPSGGGKSGGTSAIMVLPDGNSLLFTSSMTREQVQTLAEGLVPIK